MFVLTTGYEQLYDRVCKLSEPINDGFISTIDSENRIRDSEKVAKEIGLPEKGRGDVMIMLTMARGL